uniref:Putative homing endonuclease n=2 Tax=viral metagenome TaxID=1070528 RepID=A0A6M3KC53_9ZZZZ
MPSTPNRPCAHPGCATFRTDGPWCAAHAPARVRVKPDGEMRVERRGTSTQRGYDRRWRDFRVWFLGRHPVCEVCGRVATMVHHKRPLRFGGDKRAEENSQALCWTCHARIHATPRALFGGVGNARPVHAGLMGGAE